jgi:hypothetical protein
LHLADKGMTDNDREENSNGQADGDNVGIYNEVIMITYQ